MSCARLSQIIHLRRVFPLLLSIDIHSRPDSQIQIRNKKRKYDIRVINIFFIEKRHRNIFSKLKKLNSLWHISTKFIFYIIFSELKKAIDI